MGGGRYAHAAGGSSRFLADRRSRDFWRWDGGTRRVGTRWGNGLELSLGRGVCSAGESLVELSRSVDTGDDRLGGLRRLRAEASRAGRDMDSRAGNRLGSTCRELVRKGATRAISNGTLQGII